MKLGWEATGSGVMCEGSPYNPRPPIPRSNRTAATTLCYNLIEASQACAYCDSAHMPHCTHQQLASSWQLWAEQTRVPSFTSSQHTSPSLCFRLFPFLILSLDIMSRLRAFMAS